MRPLMRVPAPGGRRSVVIVLLLLLPIAAWAEDCTVFFGEADLGPLARAPRALVVQEGAILAADAYGLTVYRADETGRLGAVAEVEIEGGCFALGTMYSFLVAPKVWSLDFLDITSMPPTTVASVRLPAPGGAVYASDYEGRQAILGLWGNASYGRLYAVSTDPPDHPLLMGQVTMGSGITAVASLGSAALAGFADGTIAKVDFSDPGTPIVGTPRPAGGAPYDILVDGDVAYVATGLQVRIASLECGPPQAGFDVTAWNLRVRLEDRTVHGADRWRWTLGDGTHASGAVVEHVFPHPGLYTVSLAIANGYGHDTVRRTLAIGGDVDWNGRVEGADAAMELAEIWDGDGISPGTAARGAHAGRPDYDLDGDGVIGASDLAWIVIMAGVSGE